MKRIKIMNADRQQRLCDAKAARGELSGCMYCVRKRTIANEGIRQVYGDY